MLRLSTTKCHRVTSGSEAIVRAIWLTKSSSFCACWSHRWRHDCAVRDVEIGEQRDGATPDVFELASLLLPRFHEPGGMFALQRLDAGHFVRRQHTLAGFYQGWR